MDGIFAHLTYPNDWQFFSYSHQVVSKNSAKFMASNVTIVASNYSYLLMAFSIAIILFVKTATKLRCCATAVLAFFYGIRQQNNQYYSQHLFSFRSMLSKSILPYAMLNISMPLASFLIWIRNQLCQASGQLRTREDYQKESFAFHMPRSQIRWQTAGWGSLSHHSQEVLIFHTYSIWAFYRDTSI